MASSHEKADALDVIRTGVQLHLRQYKRRVQTAAEAEYERLALEHERSHAAAPFDHLAAASKALSNATREWLGVESPVETKALDAAAEA